VASPVLARANHARKVLAPAARNMRDLLKTRWPTSILRHRRLVEPGINETDRASTAPCTTQAR